VGYLQTRDVFVRNTVCPLLRRFDFFLPLTLKDDLDLERPPLKMCNFMRTPLWIFFLLLTLKDDLDGWPWPWTHTTHNVQLHENAALDYFFDLWPWRMTLTNDLDLEPLTMCSFIGTPLWLFFLTFDLQGWPWPFTTQKV